MFLFDQVKSACQIKLPDCTPNPGIPVLDEVGKTHRGISKWNKSRIKDTCMELHKVLVTSCHTFAVCQNVLVIHNCQNPSKDLDLIDSTLLPKKEIILNYHESPISCMSYDEASGLLCSCSDEAVFLLRWDSILGEWEKFRISEGEGRVSSCCVKCNDRRIIASVFKSDSIIVYEMAAVHAVVEPGPLILESIQCLTTLDKVKDLTTHCYFMEEQSSVYIIGVSSGNAVSIKMWELQAESKTLKLIHHRTVRSIRTVAACDITNQDGLWLLLLMGEDGSVETYLIKDSGVFPLDCLKIDDFPDNLPSVTSSSLNSAVIQPSEIRTLCAKFISLEMLNSNQFELLTDQLGEFKGYDSSLNKPTVDGNNQQESTSGEVGFRNPNDSNTSIQRSEEVRAFHPKLAVAIATTTFIGVLNTKSGEFDYKLQYSEILKDDSIMVRNANLAWNAAASEIVVALQPCLAQIVFCRRVSMKLDPLQNSSRTASSSLCSLISRGTFDPKSVLRKRLKSPPARAQADPYKTDPKFKFSPSNKPPSWARARSRPSIPTSKSATKGIAGSSLRSARTQHHSIRSNHNKSSAGIQNSDTTGGLMSSRPIRIRINAAYENSEGLADNTNFLKCEGTALHSRMGDGLSCVRMSGNNDGKLLALGGNIGPLIIMRSQPFECIRLLKDVCKVTSLNFSFCSEFLLISSNDGKTSMIKWASSRELLSFQFNSKFNEHIHSQFYFMDKFILQPEENKVALYSYAKRDTGYIKLIAGSFPLPGQNITALAAVNQFYSNHIIAGLSNKSLQIFDANVEKVGMSIKMAHTKPVSTIRINEAPRGKQATDLCDFILTSSFTSVDPIKLWDLRSAKCVFRISDINPALCVPTSRPALSPCGRYVASGFEANTLALYDVRKINSRLSTFKGFKSSVLDCRFDTNHPMIWCGCRNGAFWNYNSF